MSSDSLQKRQRISSRAIPLLIKLKEALTNATIESRPKECSYTPDFEFKYKYYYTSGLCGLVVALLRFDEISVESYNFLQDYLVKNKPENKVKHSYWFTHVTVDQILARQERLDFLTTLIEQEEAELCKDSS